MFRTARQFSQVLVVAWISLTGPGAARAAEATAEDQLRQGLELRKKGDDQGALPFFQDAFKRSPSPRAAGQLGFCHQGLGQWAEAEVFLAKALDNDTDPWVRKNLSVIQNSLGTVRAHIARVEVIGDPPGAEVLINGIVVGKLPMGGPVRVSAGEVEVEVRVAGQVGKTKSFRMEGGQYQRVVLRIDRQPVAPMAVASGAPASSAVTPGNVASDNPGAITAEGSSTGGAPGVLEKPADESPQVRPVLKWVAWGAGLVGLGVGVYGVVANRQRVDSFGKGCGIAQGMAVADTPGFTNSQCASLKSSYESATTIAIVGFIGAAALGAAGFALWATEPAQPQGSGVAAARCSPTLSTRFEPALGCAFRF